MKTFDEPRLISRLEQLPRPFRVAFAAVCAERQLANYRAFHQRTGAGDPEALGGALDRCWSDLENPEMDEREMRSLVEQCMSSLPEEDDDSELSPSAEDCVASVAYALRTLLGGEAREAAWSARRAYEALDTFVSESMRTDSVETLAASLLRERDGRVLAHPLVQAELERQERDLHSLLGAFHDGRDITTMIDLLRSRARMESALFFKTP